VEKFQDRPTILAHNVMFLSAVSLAVTGGGQPLLASLSLRP